MRTLRSVFGVIGALMPVIYFGYLIYYFLDVSGSMHDAEQNGLGPILIGLGVVAALFGLVALVRTVRIFIRPREPRSGGDDGPDDSGPDDTFDADAVVARHLALRRAEAASGSAPSPAAPPARDAKRPGFGRRKR